VLGWHRLVLLGMFHPLNILFVTRNQWLILFSDIFINLVEHISILFLKSVLNFL
jgi:hypothetical protein